MPRNTKTNTALSVTIQAANKVRKLNGHHPLLKQYQFVELLCEVYEQAAKTDPAIVANALKACEARWFGKK